MVESDTDLFRAIDKYSPGDRVSVEVTRLTRTSEEQARLNLQLQAIDAA